MDWREIVEKFLTANEEKKKEQHRTSESLDKYRNGRNVGKRTENRSKRTTSTSAAKSIIAKCRKKFLYLTAGVDVQDDRFEAEVVGWGVDKESWGIEYQSHLRRFEAKARMGRTGPLSQTFTTADGRHLKIICACVDSGGHFTTQVYRFCKERTARRVFAIKGKGGAEVPYFQPPVHGKQHQNPAFHCGR